MAIKTRKNQDKDKKATKDKGVKAQNDAWTGMLAVSLLALIGGCVLLFLDWSQYPEKDPPPVKKFVPAAVAPPQQQQAPPDAADPKAADPKAADPKAGM